jgi:hypothetical protein
MKWINDLMRSNNVARLVLEASVIIPKHGQKAILRAHETKLRFQIITQHKSFEVTAIFLELPLAEHLNKREHVQACGIDALMLGMREALMMMPHKLN